MRKLVLASDVKLDKAKVAEDDDDDVDSQCVPAELSQLQSRASPVGNGIYSSHVIQSVETKKEASGSLAVTSADSKTKTVKPKPPASPRVLPRKTLQSLPVQISGKKSPDTTLTSSRQNPTKKPGSSKVTPSIGNKQSELRSKPKVTKYDAMSVSLDAAHCQMVLGSNPQPAMTSSVCVPSSGEAFYTESRAPVVIDETKPNLTRSKSVTSLGSRKESKIATRKASTAELGTRTRKETGSDSSSQKVSDKVAVKIRVSSAKDTNRSLHPQKPSTTTPGKRPASARNTAEK